MLEMPGSNALKVTVDPPRRFVILSPITPLSLDYRALARSPSLRVSLLLLPLPPYPRARLLRFRTSPFLTPSFARLPLPLLLFSYTILFPSPSLLLLFPCSFPLSPLLRIPSHSSFSLFYPLLRSNLLPSPFLSHLSFVSPSLLLLLFLLSPSLPLFLFPLPFLPSSSSPLLSSSYPSHHLSFTLPHPVFPLHRFPSLPIVSPSPTPPSLIPTLILGLPLPSSNLPLILSSHQL